MGTVTPGWAVLIVLAAYTGGWWACRTEARAAAERAANRLRPFHPPRSNVRPIPNTTIYDQETHP